jgi:hypothetical protein
MKLYDTELLDETSGLSDKQFRLYLRMMSFQFRHQVGFTTPQHCVQVMGITQRSASNVEAIMTALGDVVDGKWWASGVHFQLIEKAEKSDKQRVKGLLGGRPKKSRSFPLEKPEENRIEENRIDNTLKDSGFLESETELVPPTVKIPYPLNENGSVASLTFKNAPPQKKMNPDFFVEHAETFQAFWEAYPRATKKPNANEAVIRALVSGAVDAETLLARTRAYAVKMKKEDKVSYAPDPHRWIEQEQWEDGELIAFMDAPVTTKEANAGLLEHEVLLKEKTLYHKPTGRLIETEGVEVKKTQFGDYVMRFSNGTIAEVGQLDIPHPEMLKGA